MGRYYWDKKDIVEDCTRLSIFKLKEFGLLNGFHVTTLTWTRKSSGWKSSIGIVVDTEELYAKVNYTITDRGTDKKTDYDYKIQLTSTPCNFGGVRYWFICPLIRKGTYCGRRTGPLFLAPGGNYFGCRHCFDLSYESRNECRLGRWGQIGYVLKADRQIEELREQIKCDFYAGKPTRKYRKLLKIQSRLHISLDSPSIRNLLNK